MTVVAALAAMATSFINRSAVSSWLSSTCRPWLFIERKNCSMIQRRLYQATICQAAAMLSTLWVVSRSQWMGFRPFQNDASETQRKMSLAQTTVHAFGHVNHRLGGKRHALDRLAKRSALDQRMVVHDPGKKVDISFRRARPMGVDVPLPIVDHRDHAGLCQSVL